MFRADGGRLDAGWEMVWNQERSSPKGCPLVFHAATPNLPLLSADLLAPIAALAALVLLRLWGRPAAVLARRRPRQR